MTLMQQPIAITFRALDPSDAISTYVKERASKLDSVYPRLVACRVVVEANGTHHRHGDRYRVRIDLGVPGTELVVCRDAGDERVHEDVYAAIDRAFEDAQRVLGDWARRRRGDVKHHEPAQRRGVVTKIFHYEGYGFLEGDDGVEVYFHRNAVHRLPFESLERGTAVRFLDEAGEKGPQATMVEPLGS